MVEHFEELLTLEHCVHKINELEAVIQGLRYQLHQLQKEFAAARKELLTYRPDPVGDWEQGWRPFS